MISPVAIDPAPSAGSVHLGPSLPAWLLEDGPDAAEAEIFLRADMEPCEGCDLYVEKPKADIGEDGEVWCHACRPSRKGLR